VIAPSTVVDIFIATPQEAPVVLTADQTIYTAIASFNSKLNLFCPPAITHDRIAEFDNPAIWYDLISSI